MTGSRPFAVAVIGGVFLGFSGLVEMALEGVSEFNRGLTGEPVAEAGAVPSQAANAVAADIADLATEQPQRGGPTYEELVAAAAAANGGQLSLTQRMAISEIAAGSSRGRADPYARPSEYGPPATAYSSLPSQQYMPPYERRASPLDVESASRRDSGRETLGSDPFGTTVVLNPAGPGLYAGTNGDMYTQAGPNGVLNTRTGQFSPAN